MFSLQFRATPHEVFEGVVDFKTDALFRHIRMAITGILSHL